MRFTLQDVLVKLPDAKKHRTGYQACCPAHDDTNPSLSITETDGKVLLKCHAGCNYESIVKVLGLWETSLPQSSKVAKKEVAAYGYHDSSGRLVYEVVRFEPKAFLQRRVEADGRRIWDMKGVQRFLYRLPAVLEAVKKGEIIYITEGEKDADNLNSLGVVATTNPGGASKWQDSFSEDLSGANVVVVVDRDEAGAKHAIKLKAELEPICQSIRFVQAKDGKDASDHIVAGFGLDDFVPFGFARTSTGLLTLQQLYELPPEDVSWTVDDLLPKGSLSILIAKPKVGKSSLIRELVRDVALGETFLNRNVDQGPVIYLAFEERIHSVREAFESMAVPPDAQILLTTSKMDCPDVETLTKLIAEHKPSLVIIDTLIRFCQVQDLNDYVGVTRAMEPLAELARSSGCSILVSHHGKKGETENNGDSALGSTALFGMVDTLIRIRVDGQNRRIISTEQRYGDSLESSMLSMDRATKRVRIEGSLHQDRMAVLRAEIFDLFTGAPIPLPMIRAVVKDNKVPQLLNEMVAEGILKRTGSGKKNSPFEFELI